MSYLDNDQVTIANGTALSAAFNLGDKTLVGIGMPAAWTAAAITLQVSCDGGTTWLEFVDSRSAGATSQFTVAASQFIAIEPTMLRGVNAIKIRSGTSGSPVNQGADRILTVVSKRVW